MALCDISSGRIFEKEIEKSEKSRLTNQTSCANISKSLRDNGYMGEWWNW